MSPVARSAGTMVRRPPRLGTSCHIRWLDFDMSTGFTSWNVAVYSTMPLRVARRELDVLDDGVVRIVGIELAEGAAGQRLVLAGGAEARAVERRRDLVLDHDLRHPRLAPDTKAATPPSQYRLQGRASGAVSVIPS